MKITRESDYAIRIILMLSSLKEGEIADAGSISKTQCIPKQFTLKILRELMTAGYVKSFKGIHGGYCLNVLPCELSLKDIICAIEGEIGINECLICENKCNRVSDTSSCPVHRSLESINNKLIAELSSVIFDDLAKGCKNNQ